MKTIILCGGKGMRMFAGEYKPKPLVEIGGTPILWHIMKSYAHQGFQDFILCLGYRGNMIKQYIADLSTLDNDVEVDMSAGVTKPLTKRTGIEGKIICADTGEESMTGARIAKIKGYLEGEEDFFLTYGDGLSDVNFKGLLEYHKQKGKILTTTGIRPASRYGLFEINEEGIATSFDEKPNIEGRRINGGFMVCNKRIFDYLTNDESCIFEKTAMPQLAKEQQLAIYNHDGFWKAMDTQKEAEEFNEIWNTGNPPWKVWK